MKRRQFARLAAMSVVVRAPSVLAQGDLPIVAVIFPGSATQAASRLEALRAGRREAGLVEGIGYTFAVRYGDGAYDRLPGLIAELAALKLRLVVSGGVATLVKKYLPPEIIHVFTATAADPIKLGLVDNYAHPGGNVTGNVMTRGGEDGAMTQKRIEYFRQLAPGFKRLGFMGSKTGPLALAELDALTVITGRLGFEVVHYPVHTIDEVEAASAATDRDGVDALYVTGEPLLIANLARSVKAIEVSGKPAVGPYPDFARAGLLMTYGTDVNSGFRRAGLYAGRIVRGEKPGDLPIEQESSFVLAVNAGTVKRLGLTVPPTFLADEVIE